MAVPTPQLRTCFSSISKAFSTACLQADLTCIQAAQQANENAGSTAALLILEGGGSSLCPTYYAHVAHAGDSRIVMCRNKQALELTRGDNAHTWQMDSLTTAEHSEPIPISIPHYLHNRGMANL